VNPIPKSSKNDPRVPLHYGGISLLSTVYKLYSSILNRLITFLEDQKTSALADSASRALGGVIGKTKTLKDIGYATYSKLYQTCVCPVLDYSAGV
jgi:hypothetical protein